jgi:y4mF family transcriptional regulator
MEPWVMKYTPVELGHYIRQRRKNLGVTQETLALTAGTGLRFISDLENGKATCEIGKVLTVLRTLGIGLTLSAP